MVDVLILMVSPSSIWMNGKLLEKIPGKTTLQGNQVRRITIVIKLLFVLVFRFTVQPDLLHMNLIIPYERLLSNRVL